MTRSPRAVPWEITLPWAPTTLNQSALAVLERDDRARGSACAKAVGTSTSRGVGTSVIAKTPNACARSGAGRPHGGRPNGARTRRSNPSTPRHNRHAVGASPLQHNHRKKPKLRRRVVTRQRFFGRFLCAPGQGAMQRRSTRSALRHATAAPPAARLFATSWTVNASGGGVGP
jgi:hypothetical protein